MMPGATTRYPPAASARNLETSAARIARSTQSRQGLEVTLHKTATSRRNTRSSTSLNAELRPTNNNRFNSHRKTRQSRHNHTRHDHAPTADHAHPPVNDPNRLLKPLRFFRKLLKGLRYVPRVIVTDKLRSYGAAHRLVMPSMEHRFSKYLNNRGENSTNPPGNANVP